MTRPCFVSGHTACVASTLYEGSRCHWGLTLADTGLSLGSLTNTKQIQREPRTRNSD